MLEQDNDFVPLKDRQIRITTAALIGFLLFAVNVAFYVGQKQAELNNKVENNTRDIASIVKEQYQVREELKIIHKIWSSIQVIEEKQREMKEDLGDAKKK